MTADNQTRNTWPSCNMFWISFPNRFLHQINPLIQKSKIRNIRYQKFAHTFSLVQNSLKLLKQARLAVFKNLHCSYVKMFIVMWRYVPRASFFRWRTQMKPMPVFFNNTITPYNFWKNLNFWPKLVVFEIFQNHLLC